MSSGKLKPAMKAAAVLCVCACLFSGARYMEWLEQDSSPWGNLARFFYGPDTRKEMRRLQTVKEISPGIPLITALCYHEVRPDRRDDCMNVDPEIFRRHIREFRKAGYTFINVDDLRLYKAGSKQLPEKAVLISFDDGYADNYDYAYPILREEQAPATFFVVSDKIGSENRMTADELREMRVGGMAIGSHTVHHENLAGMTGEEIDFEMRESKESLEKILGNPVCAVAYPGGKTNGAVLDKVKKYYDVAFVASVSPETKQTMYTLQRYGVFKWNEHIESIFKNR